jgi:hypothetical protein
VAIHFIKENASGKTGAFATQRGGATVNVIVAGSAGRELELSQAKGVASK